MKHILLTICALSAFILTSLSFADDAHPCKNIEAACKAVGFYKGGASTGKGLYKDCIQPITEGKSIAGVTVSATDAAACKQKIAQMQQENKK